jgi:hypothetical protein
MAEGLKVKLNHDVCACLLLLHNDCRQAREAVLQLSETSPPPYTPTIQNYPLFFALFPAGWLSSGGVDCPRFWPVDAPDEPEFNENTLPPL